MNLPGLDLAVLRPMLSEHVEVVGELRAEPIAGGKSNLTYRIADDRSRWVFRRPPTAGLTPSAHDVAREFRVMSALSGSGVPVPPAVLLCTDPEVMGAPFTVVGHVDGRALRVQSDLDGLDDDELDRCAHELVRVLAALHAVEPREVDLQGFGRPGYVERQIGLWHRQWQLVSREPSADVVRLHDALATRVPAERPLSIVHGDFRIDNTLIDHEDAGSVRAVIDWELATLGDSRGDLAMSCVYRHPAFDLVMGEPAASTSARMPDAHWWAASYSRAAGDDLGDWSFYLALAYFKLGVIAEGIRHRHTAGATAGEGFAAAGDAVPELVAAGLRALHPTSRSTSTIAGHDPARQENS